VITRAGLMCAVLLVFACCWAGVTPALAQPSADQVQAAREGYVPVKDLPAAEQLPAAPLVLGAYAFIWIALLAYLWTIWRRLASVDRELVALRRAIARRE
jgi:CcmD family protein